MAKGSGTTGGRKDQEVNAMRDALQALQGLQQDEQQRALTWLGQKLGVGIPLPPAGGPHTPGAPLGMGSPSADAQTPKVFMAKKRPDTVQERITCLAYYLTHYRNTPAFKTKDLTKLNSEAAQPKISNPAFFARNAANAQYLALAGGGNKQITARGEALVTALPDREAVKKALGDYPLTGKKGKGAKKKKAARS